MDLASQMSSTPDSRVIKKLKPGVPGTLKLLDRYGTDLVCVRYRESPCGKYRHTTIEIIIDTRETQATRTKNHTRLRNEDFVLLQGIQDKATRAQLLSYGASYNSRTQTWRVKWLIVKYLKLTKYLTTYP